MSIVTLTTDWKSGDFYPGIIKGQILNHCPEARIVDISHQIAPFDIAQAAFVVKHSFRYYPPGTVHIIGVKSESDEDTQGYIVVKACEQFFIGADNGIFSLIFDDMTEVEINNIEPDDNVRNHTTFPEFDLFTSAAVHIIKNGETSGLGKPVQQINTLTMLRPITDEKTIRGNVVYIDSFENVITNISAQLFNEIRRNRKFEIYLKGPYNKIKKINTQYNQTPPGELLAIFNSLGLLEIAIYNGNAAGLLDVSIRDAVTIKFRE